MSRRHQDIKDKEQQIVAASRKERRSRTVPDELSAQSRNTSCPPPRGKRQGQGHDARRSAGLLGFAADGRGEGGRSTPPSTGPGKGLNPKPESRAAEARAYAIAHHFYRNSVVDFHDLAVTAMEKSMGAARPEDFAPDAWRQGRAAVPGQ